MRSHHATAPIPPDTLKTARAILGQDNIYLTIGDNWPQLMTEIHFKLTTDERAAQRWMPSTPALSTILQYKEKLSDRQAEQASRLRVEWKYALHLPLYHPGLSQTMLCIFRQRVYLDPAWQQDFQLILDRFVARGLLQRNQDAALTSEAVLDDVCLRSRLEEILLSLRGALEALAAVDPAWFRENLLPDWYTRYHIFKSANDLPVSATHQGNLAETLGGDIDHLFKALAHSDRPDLSRLEEIKALHRAWLEQFAFSGEGSFQRRSRCSFCGSLNASGALGGSNHT